MLDLKNDKILKINSIKVEGARQIIDIVKANENKVLNFLILRNSKKFLLKLFLRI